MCDRDYTIMKGTEEVFRECLLTVSLSYQITTKSRWKTIRRKQFIHVINPNV